MNRRRRRAEATAANYWPGYVDALTNVVLNLLFLIAMFGIALAVMNSTPRHAGKDSGAAAQARAAGAGEAGEAGGRNGAAGSAAAAVQLARADAASVPGVRLGPLAGERGRGATAQPAGLPRGAEPGLAPPPAPLPPAPAAPQPGSGPGTAPGRGGDPAGAARLAGGDAPAPGPRRDGPGALGQGYPPPGVPAAQRDLLIADAYQRRLMPGVRVLRQADPAGGVLITVTLALGTEPVAALQQPGVRTSLRVSLADDAPPAASRLRLWTATRLTDAGLRRAAYLALVEARNQLLALGYPAAAIETRLIEGSTVGREGKQIYIHAAPATAG